MTDFTIADVLTWARTKPAGEEYNFCDAGVCALGQFAREHTDISAIEAACESYRSMFAPAEFETLRKGANGRGREWTFGAFVARIEALCPETPVPQSEWAAIDAYLTDIDAVSADRLLEDEGSCQEVTKQIREWREEDRRAGIIWSDEQ